jgi:hypothetical protein
MDCTSGMEHQAYECILLKKTIYGLVQSARQFYKKLMKTLRNIGFTGGRADPCLVTQRSNKGIVYVACYMDDIFAVGHDEAIKEVIVQNELTDYLSCNILFNRNKSIAWLGQPHLIKNIKRKFGGLVEKLQKYCTPGTPGYGVVRPKEGNAKVTTEEQAMYRSGVGMLLYLAKHSRPDIANVVRELSKVMDGATPAALKELKRVMKFVLENIWPENRTQEN